MRRLPGPAGRPLCEGVKTPEAPVGLFRGWQRTQTQSSVRTLRSLRQQMDVWFCLMQESSAERHCCVTADPDQINCAPSGARPGILCFSLDFDWVENHSSGRICYRFDFVSKHSEFPDHGCGAALLGLFRNCRTAFFIRNAVMQNYPDQMTEAIRNYADRLVMSQARNETTIHDLENASLALNCSIRSLIEDAAHLAVALGRVSAAVHARALFLTWACPYPRGEVFG